ncbi:DMT family transporter [Sphingobacterium sp. SRCM116780]|uniref:DMT family transporter n=1 Tax=Sphingobacterium sp. SRCM116780 TaxID=2907623 RepID=UPI001F3BE868|nr:DMT family transporter [Sphingobacterium sp. SRCM116780]UIR54556.1 DMT family transporter [Sphingobacterium sp. SRCM116780]
MIFVLLSVLCSVTVAVLLKYAKLLQLSTKQIIVWNYPVAVLLTYFVLQPQLEIVHFQKIPWELYVPLAVLLPSLFIFISLAIQYTGLVKAEIAQRLSLFIPLLASFLLFSETISWNKGLGIFVGLLAIICSIGWQKHAGNRMDRRGTIVYPLLVFVGMGIIDIFFKQIALNKTVPYITAMFIVFVLAMGVAFLFLIYFLVIEKQRFSIKSLLLGILLGVFNFGNILFYMKAHRAIPENPSIVFTGMNIGVISLGALIGVLLFKEKLSFVNKIGLGLSILSVLIITYL